MSDSFSDSVNKILSENRKIDINQSGKTLIENVNDNDIQIDRDGQDKFHREKKLLGPGRFKKWFKRRTLKKSDLTDQEQEQHHQDNRKLTASGVKEDVEQIDEKYLLASEDLAAVRKQAKQLANKFPKMRFYVIHNKKHVGFGERYEIVTNVNFHMYRNMPIQGQYDGKRYMNESVEANEAHEVTYKPASDRESRLIDNAVEGSSMSKHLHSSEKGSDGKWKLRFRSKRGYKNFAVNYPGTYTNKSNESVELDEVVQQWDHDNSGQKVGYTNKKLSDKHVSKLRRKYPEGSVEKDNDGNHVVYTGQYRKESVELGEAQRPTRTAVNQEFKRVHGKQMDTGAATRHVEKKFNINNVKVQTDNDGNRHVISFNEAKTKIDVSPYKKSHDKRPYHKETGGWAFGPSTTGKPSFTAPRDMTYSDARTAAIKHGEEKGHGRLYVYGSYDATSAADDFLNELSQEFGAENITLDTIMENIEELETLLTSLKEYFGVDESAEGDTILTAHDIASTNDPYEHQTMAVQKIKDLINKERNEETKTKESNNGN